MGFRLNFIMTCLPCLYRATRGRQSFKFVAPRIGGRRQLRFFLLCLWKLIYSTFRYVGVVTQSAQVVSLLVPCTCTSALNCQQQRFTNGHRTPFLFTSFPKCTLIKYSSLRLATQLWWKWLFLLFLLFSLLLFTFSFTQWIIGIALCSSTRIMLRVRGLPLFHTGKSCAVPCLQHV